MDNIRTTIDALFKDVSIEEVISRINPYKPSIAESINKQWYLDEIEDREIGYTRDEIENLYRITNNEWLIHPDRTNEEKKRNPNKSIINLLLHYTKDMLLEESDEPVCKFDQLLRWRELSYQLGEDIFTCSYLANKDNKACRTRKYFGWRPVINNDNKTLRYILDKGTSELHFHLWGSAFVFDLNWISLMNFITKRQSDFNKLGTPKNLAKNYEFESSNRSLYSYCTIAAAIRVLLFCQTNSIKLDDISCLKINNIINTKFDGDIEIYRSDLQREISLLRNEYGFLYENDVLDYAIPRQLTERDYSKKHLSNTLLVGERKLLYDCFSAYLQDPVNNSRLSELLYLYIIIKTRFRNELIQVNNRVGFRNFSEYQARKDYFIEGRKLYENIAANSAIVSTMTDQNVEYLEARITPKSTKSALRNTIKNIDKSVNCGSYITNYDKYKCYKCPHSKLKCNAVDKGFEGEYHYIAHFIKSTDKKEKKWTWELEVKPRNTLLREKVKKEAIVLNKLRKGGTIEKERMVGIDAASSEIGHRPEIFAQAYRYLKYYSYRSELEFISEFKFPCYGYTFHAGEDFLDIVDGLRAIDESMLFLNLTRGDRIGHALALGQNAEDYYRLKRGKLIMPRQDFLDNCVWLLLKIRKYNIDVSKSLIDDLQWKVKRYYRDIFKDDLLHIEDYYQSWLLRGDDPTLYWYSSAQMLDNKLVRKDLFKHITNFWSHCGINNFNQEIIDAGTNKKAVEILMKYHYSKDAKESGCVEEEFEMPSGYACLVEALQVKLRKELAKQHIAIECNPTSNQVIGTYKRYSEHPIIRFNNHILYDYDGRDCDSPQLSVSLNTDDQGVFATYLENEYALMAIALEKEMDEKGELMHKQRSIYDWLERIRTLGHEQRFKK